MEQIDAACEACGAGHDDARQQVVLRLRRQLAAGSYQPNLAEVIDRLFAAVTRRLGPGPGSRR